MVKTNPKIQLKNIDSFIIQKCQKLLINSEAKNGINMGWRQKAF